MSELTAEQAYVLVQNTVLGTIQSESRTTKAVLAAVPNANLDYRPDPCAKSAIELVRHIAVSENRFLECVSTGIFNASSPVLPENITAPADIAAWYEQNFARCLSVPMAMREDVLLCYEMNGQPLTSGHGFPVRLVVPGWFGIAWVKWLERIEVRDRALKTRFMAKDYVTAAKVTGAGPVRLMFKEILPNCVAPLIVQATLGISTAILDAAALGFLGLGAQPPLPEWGTMLADAREFVLRAWWVVTFPGAMILVTVLAFNLLGDGLRDALDPKLKR